MNSCCERRKTRQYNFKWNELNSTSIESIAENIRFLWAARKKTWSVTTNVVCDQQKILLFSVSNIHLKWFYFDWTVDWLPKVTQLFSRFIENPFCFTYFRIELLLFQLYTSSESTNKIESYLDQLAAAKFALILNGSWFESTAVRAVFQRPRRQETDWVRTSCDSLSPPPRLASCPVRGNAPPLEAPLVGTSPPNPPPHLHYVKRQFVPISSRKRQFVPFWDFKIGRIVAFWNLWYELSPPNPCIRIFVWEILTWYQFSFPIQISFKPLRNQQWHSWRTKQEKESLLDWQMVHSTDKNESKVLDHIAYGRSWQRKCKNFEQNGDRNWTSEKSLRVVYLRRPEASVNWHQKVHPVFSRRFSSEKCPTITVASFLSFSSDYNLTLIGPLFLQSKLLP